RFMTRRNFLLNGAGVRSLWSMIPEVNTELPERIVPNRESVMMIRKGSAALEVRDAALWRIRAHLGPRPLRRTASASRRGVAFWSASPQRVTSRTVVTARHRSRHQSREYKLR